jgi:serine/threonine protein kinase
VYLAFDKRLDREVALGLIKSEDLDERELTAIWRGAQAMARLSGHPNTIAIYDGGEDHQGRMYLVTEYLAGGTLDVMLARGLVPTRTVPQIAAGVGAGTCRCTRRGHHPRRPQTRQRLVLKSGCRKDWWLRRCANH